MAKKEHSDKELMSLLGIDAQTLSRFRDVQKQTMKEAESMASNPNKKLRVLGISGSARDKGDMAREDSNSESLLKVCLDECKNLGADVELIKLRNHKIEHCKACYSTANTQCHFYCSCYPKGTNLGDDMSNMLYDKILQADAIIIATPVNNFSMSSLMKVFLDRCISLDGSLRPADPDDPKNKELNIKHMKFIEMAADESKPGSGMLKRFAGKVGGIITTGHEEGASMAISAIYMTLTHYGVLFPPFSNMYAMSSVCNSTYKDKKIVLSECYSGEAKHLAENVMKAANISRGAKMTSWKYDYDAN